MKLHHAGLIGLLCSLMFLGTARAEIKGGYSDAHRFIFYAVLEGCYEDGLSSNDVAQVLMRRTNEFNFHFIYACPLCMAALHGFEAYQSRPARFSNMKSETGTFGPGLDPDLKRMLYSEKTEDRLAAINTLVQRWVKQRMTMMRLAEAEHAKLQKDLEAMRKKGMQALQTFLADGQASKMAPAYGKKSECAICNAAVGMALPKRD